MCTQDPDYFHSFLREKIKLCFLVEKASDGILDVFRFDSGFQVVDLDLDSGDEMSDRSPGSNYFIKGSVQPSSAFCGTFQFHYQLLGARLPDSLYCGAQSFRVDSLLGSCRIEA